MKNWIKLLNRKCSLAFQAEVPLVNNIYLPKIIGVSIRNFWCESITFGVYYQRQELENLAEVIKEKLIAHPSFAKRNIQECLRLGNVLLKASAIKGRVNHLNNSELLSLLNRFRNAYLNFLPYLVYPHAIERYFMEILSKELKRHLATLKKGEQFDALFEGLTTPSILETDEQIDLLKAASAIKKEGWTDKTRRLIEAVRNKYGWQLFWTITAKPLTYNYFKDAVFALVESNKDLNAEIKRVKQAQTDRKKELIRVLDQIKAPKTLRAYTELLQGYMYLRTYRKNIISKAHFSHLPLLMAIRQRMGIGDGIKFISYEEMVSYLKSGATVSDAIIEKRKKAWAVLSIDGRISIASGKDSIEKISKEYRIEDIKKSYLKKSVKGRPACLGKVTGRVKVIKNVSEFNKIKNGDILVTCMTTPEYVPIMRKVSAIVTDEGGVTCHAAIVSREFNIPCIVGTEYATKTFKDGDLVEVDANKGIVKIIKNRG